MLMKTKGDEKQVSSFRCQVSATRNRRRRGGWSLVRETQMKVHPAMLMKTKEDGIYSDSV